jgi:hypothetical protein
MRSTGEMDQSIVGVYTIICSRGTKLYIILCSLQTLQMLFLFRVYVANACFSFGLFFQGSLISLKFNIVINRTRCELALTSTSKES